MVQMFISILYLPTLLPLDESPLGISLFYGFEIVGGITEKVEKFGIFLWGNLYGLDFPVES